MIRERRLDLAVRIMVSGDVVFVAKLGTTAPPWMKPETDERLRSDEA